MRLAIPVRLLLQILAMCLAIASSVQAQYREYTPCTPYGTFADELRNRKMHADPPPVKFRIVQVDIRGALQMPGRELDQLVASLKSREFEDDGKLIETLEQHEVRRFWQDRGYFKIQAKATAAVVGDPAERKAAVEINVEEDRQYRLHEIRFQDVTAFPTEQLRKLIPLADGEIFATDRIRQGLDAMRIFYANHGYIDFTVAPHTQELDWNHEILLSLRVAEEQQFRIWKIEVVGLSADQQKRLNWKIRSGDIFRYNDYLAFFEDNKDLIPADASQTVSIDRDIDRGLISLTFDFTRCAPH